VAHVPVGEPGATSPEHALMPLASLAVIGGTILVSSFISGTFGMAGGMVLLGVLLVYFPVTTAMVLFSIIQLVANA
jgi:Flp pilus assembly pilin Flp